MGDNLVGRLLRHIPMCWLLHGLLRRRQIRQWLHILFLSSLTLCLWLGQAPSQIFQIAIFGSPIGSTTAQALDADQLVAQGVEQYQAGEFQTAIATWQSALDLYQQNGNLTYAAVVQENLARAHQQIGETTAAIAQWEQAVSLYQQLDDQPQLGRMLTELAQAYSSQGQHRRAIALLCGAASGATSSADCTAGSALQLATANGDPVAQAAALGSLGEAYRLSGSYQQAIQSLEAGLAVATEAEQPSYQAAVLNSLGQTYAAQAQINDRRAEDAARRSSQTLDLDDLDSLPAGTDAVRYRQAAIQEAETARDYFQQSWQIAQAQADPTRQLQALLGLVAVHQRLADQPTAQTYWQQAVTLLDQIPDSHTKVYTAIELAHLQLPGSKLAQATAASCSRSAVSMSQSGSTVRSLLEKAVQISEQLGSQRAKSFALGELGHLYECSPNQVPKALELTEAAWTAADLANAPDSLYLWQWQTGRLLKTQGKRNEAIDAYEAAIATLEQVRRDILVAEQELQFDFRDTVNPVYRELTALRLDPIPTSTAFDQNSDRETDLTKALINIDALKLAELQNYFGSDCILPIATQPVDELVESSQTAAVLSTIVLPERTAVIASFPDGTKQIEWIDLDQTQIRGQILTFRQGLQRWYDRTYDYQPAQVVYDWLVRPFEVKLAQSGIKTLVFIHDGLLRTIPMAALHDGERFLIEKYAIATAPTLRLTNVEPTDRQRLRALVLGLSEAVQISDKTFPALNYVNSEVNQIAALLPRETLLLNQDFNLTRLEQELQEQTYSIVHIATHGQFESEPEATFLVAGSAETLTIGKLDDLIRNSATSPREAIELIALTACKTADGDDRAALGLAGVTIRAGAKSALASLWSVNDETTAQVAASFYRGFLQEGLSKAEALQQAQISLIQDPNQFLHPGRWAPFVLIGNWQ